MALFPSIDDNAIYFSMYETDQFCSRYALKAFQLDKAEWPSIEHYYQAMKFSKTEHQEKIRQLSTPELATKMGNKRFQRKRDNWQEVQITVMTRAVYIQCRTHVDIAEKLLETNDENLVEDSQFDYFWGCGRDRRGKNHFGQVLMNVRVKLREEIASETIVK